MAREIRILKFEAGRWDTTFPTATSMSETASRQQAGQIGKLEETLKEVRFAKITTDEEVKKYKEVVEGATRVVSKHN